MTKKGWPTGHGCVLYVPLSGVSRNVGPTATTIISPPDLRSSHGDIPRKLHSAAHLLVQKHWTSDIVRELCRCWGAVHSVDLYSRVDRYTK